MSWPHLMLLALICLMATWSLAAGSKRNYDAKYSNMNIPQWKQRACEKPKQNKANAHYICDDKGDVKCLPGWQGDLCQVPMCRRGCDPMNGYCQRPGECRCRIGYTGEHCEKCMTLPGCQHGTCNKPFECLCKPGWDGLFCTEPTCRQGCHSTRGYCEAPGECRCRIGWSGRTCSDCAVLPGCQHGTCKKPLDCQCLPGYTGLLCQTAICESECNKLHGYCRKPHECRCKVGWQGPRCDACHPYPGCVNGDCEQPWECNCRSGWGGMLCDEKLTFCEENPNTCENAGKCISLTKGDGQFRCLCRQGYLGKNCEIVDEFLITSTAAPRITPPHGNDFSYAETTTARPTATKKTETPTATLATLTETATSIGNNVSTAKTTSETLVRQTAEYLNETDAGQKREEGMAEHVIKGTTATTTTITPPTKATHVLSLLRTNGAQKKFTSVVGGGNGRYPDEPLIFPTMNTEKTTPTPNTTISPLTLTTTPATVAEKSVTLITATLQPNKVNLTKLTTSVPASASGLVDNATRLNDPNRKGSDNEVTNVVVAVAGTDGVKQEVAQKVNKNNAGSVADEGHNDENDDDDDDDDEDDEEDEDEDDDDDEDVDDEEDNDDLLTPNLFNNNLS